MEKIIVLSIIKNIKRIFFLKVLLGAFSLKDMTISIIEIIIKKIMTMNNW